MKSYLGSVKLKERFVKEIGKHEKADAIVRGHYGKVEGGKWRGCAVGCSLKSMNTINKKNVSTSAHERYELELGIPRILARLEDGIFENLPDGEWETWTRRFAEAVPVGQDLSLVWPKFAIWLLTDKKHGVIQYVKPKGKAAILKVAELYGQVVKGKTVEAGVWKDASASASADAASASASAASAYADAYADAASASASAASAYAASAYAAYAASADAAAYASASADAAYAAAYAASAAYASRKKHYSIMAKKLISLIKSAK